MKHLLAAFILLAPLLCLCGCGIGHTESSFEAFGVKMKSTADVAYFVKDPHWGKGNVNPWGVTVNDYASTTRTDAINAVGGIVGTVAGAVVKAITGVP